MKAPADFPRAIAAWCEAHIMDWRQLWLGPTCRFLTAARQVACDFDRDDLAELEKLRQLTSDQHLQCVHALCPPDRSEPTPAEQTAWSRRAWLTQGLLAAVAAARAIRGWRTDEELPSPFADAALRCAEAYHCAWPIGGQPVACLQSHFHAPTPADSPSIVAALNRLAGCCTSPHLHTTTWLILRRLLTYLLGHRDAPYRFETQATLLLYDENGPRGIPGPLDVRTAEEGQTGCYLDPVAMGGAAIDDRMADSLRLAWRITRCELSRQIETPQFRPLAVRLSPGLTFDLFLGGSAGGLLACAMYAAATRTGLNTDVSASFCIGLAESAGESPDDLQPDQIVTQPVGQASVPHKLRAARSHVQPVRRVLLHPSQVEQNRPIAKDIGVDLVGVSSLAQAFPLLTGDAAIERVLERYCRQHVEQWEAARQCEEEEDPDLLRYYVEPHYSLLTHGKPSETSQRLPEGGGESGERQADPYQPVAKPGDDWSVELVKLLSSSRRLCLTEDSGAGKSIFTRRLQAFLCSPQGQQALFGNRPALVVRWEQRVRTWPASFERADFIAKLAEIVSPAVAASPTSATAAAVAEWALHHGRVFLILDALDQVTKPESLESLEESLNTGPLRDCPIVMTSRVFAVTDNWPMFEQTRGWQFARIDGFDRPQQEQYLQPYDLDELFPDYEAVKPLLRVPLILALIRRLVKAGEYHKFRTRADLYYQVHEHFTKRAARKLGLRTGASDLFRWREVLAAAACEMMTREQYGYAVQGVDAIIGVREGASRRCGRPVTDDEWRVLGEFSQLTDRCILEGATKENWCWTHRGMMEFYCGIHLARNSQPRWITEDKQGHIRCGDEKVRRLAANPNWRWAYRFAIEMPTEVWQETPDTLTASLTELFQPPSSMSTISPSPRYSGERVGVRGTADSQGTAPAAPLPRPTELIYRAWPLLDPDLLDPAREDLDPARPTLPRGPEVINAFQAGAAAVVKTMQFVRCPKNPTDDSVPFQMGAPEGEKGYYDNERPQHRVIVTPFLLQTTPVTNAQFELFDPTHRSSRGKYSPHDNCPVINVSWYDAWAFSRWVGGRLPTEAEWERACRAGSAARWSFGDDEATLGEYAWYETNSSGTTHPVGEKWPNVWGLYDMHGNVWEWCSDWYGVYAPGEVRDPTGPASASGRVFRGGSWYRAAAYCRSAYRNRHSPSSRYLILGFRLAAVQSPS